MIKLKYTLKDADEWYKVASDSVEDKAHQVDEHPETYVQATKALKALYDKVVDMTQALHDSLHQTMRDVFRVHKRVVEQVRRFCPGALIFAKALAPLKYASRVNQEDDSGASDSNVPA